MPSSSRSTRSRPSWPRPALLLLLSHAMAGCAHRGPLLLPSQMVRPAAPPPPSWAAPVPTLVPLLSGMEVAVLTDRALPLVHVTVIVKAGSALDGEREGLAAATAGMLLEGGAGVRSGPELAEALELLGDELQIVPDADAVVFHLATPSRRLQRALSLLSDVLRRPRFDEEAWRRERTRRIAEIAAEGDEPDKLADRVFDRVLFANPLPGGALPAIPLPAVHPYGHAPLGTARGLARLEVAELRAFYEANYGPRATTLLLVGDVGPEMVPVVAGAFDAWTGGPVATPPAPPLPPGVQASPPRLVLVDRPGAAQSQLRVGGPGVARASADFPSSALLETLLGGSFTSRLMQNLRELHGYTYSVSADFVARDAPGSLLVKTAVRTDATADALGEILAELRRLRTPVEEAELAKARRLIGGELIEAFSDGAGASQLLASALSHRVGPDAWRRLGAEIEAIDAAHLATAAARLVDPARLTIVVVGDRARIEESLAKLPNLPPIELRDALGELRPAPAPAPVVAPAPAPVVTPTPAPPSPSP